MNDEFVPTKCIFLLSCMSALLPNAASRTYPLSIVRCRARFSHFSQYSPARDREFEDIRPRRQSGHSNSPGGRSWRDSAKNLDVTSQKKPNARGGQYKGASLSKKAPRPKFLPDVPSNPALSVIDADLPLSFSLDRQKNAPTNSNAVPGDSHPFSKAPASEKIITMPAKGLAAPFSSPPLMPGLLASLQDLIGPSALPTPIQTLSMQHLLTPHPSPPTQNMQEWKQFLLAAETGSGKSIAYLLPLLQSLKEAEHQSSSTIGTSGAFNPRALILAPTHELSRQLSGFAKALIHSIKLRIMCASQTNTTTNKMLKNTTASGMRSMLDGVAFSDDGNGFQYGGRSAAPGHAVDVMVGTPMKLMEMARGRGWDRPTTDRGVGEIDAAAAAKAREELEAASGRKLRRGRDKIPGVGQWTRSIPEMGLANVQWVIVDEADVLLGTSQMALP